MIALLLALLVLAIPTVAWAQPGPMSDAVITVAAPGPAVAPAAIPDPIAESSDFAQLALDAVRSSDWKIVAILALILFVALARRFGARYWKFLATGRGGALLVLVTGILSTLATTLLNSQGVSFRMLLDGVVMGISAAGGYTVVRKLLLMPDVKDDRLDPNPS